MSSNVDEIFQRNLRTFLKPIIPFWDDKSVSALFIHRPNEIWVERSTGLERADLAMDASELEQAVKNVAQFFGVLLSEEHPELHTSLPNGTGISIVVPPIARSGPVLTLRKPSAASLSFDELIETEFLTPAAASFLRSAYIARQSMLIVGPPASGKSTLMRALVEQVPDNERLIFIEQRREMEVHHPNVISFEAKGADQYGKGEISVKHLLLSAAALRPHRMLLGELRGVEALDFVRLLNAAFQGSVTTLNAHDPLNALHRVESFCFYEHASLPLDSLRAFISNAFQLLVVCQQFPNGRRCVSEIHEVLPANRDGNYIIKTLFRLDSSGQGEKEITNALKPFGNLPKRLDRLKQYGFHAFDRVFFNPENYDEHGKKIPERNIPLSEDSAEVVHYSSPSLPAAPQESSVLSTLAPLLQQIAASTKLTPPNESAKNKRTPLPETHIPTSLPEETPLVTRESQNKEEHRPTPKPATRPPQEPNKQPPAHSAPFGTPQSLHNQETNTPAPTLSNEEEQETSKHPEFWEREETFAKSKDVNAAWGGASAEQLSQQPTTSKPSPAASRGGRTLAEEPPEVLSEDDMFQLQNELETSDIVELYEEDDDDDEQPTMAGVPVPSFRSRDLPQNTPTSARPPEAAGMPPLANALRKPGTGKPTEPPASLMQRGAPPPMKRPSHQPERSVVVRRGNRQPQPPPSQPDHPLFGLDASEQTSVGARPSKPPAQRGQDGSTAPTMTRESPAQNQALPQRANIGLDEPVPSQPTVIRGRRPPSRKK